MVGGEDMTQWEVVDFRIPEWKGKFRWSLEPENWLARILWKHIKVNVVIDYIQAIKER